MEKTLNLILDKLDSIDSDVKDLKKQVLIIENDHGKKLDALFDGYKQVYEGQQEIKKDIKGIKEALGIHEAKLLKVKESE